MKKLVQMIKAKTPKVGRRLAGIGIGIGGVGVGLEFMEPNIMDYLPEQHRIYYVALKMIMQGIGLIMFGAGAASTTGNPDEKI